MKFGLFYEHQLPRPWSENSEQQLINDALEQCELADTIGFDYIWEVEHHYLEEYSHSSAPEVFLAAASQRTKNIRLGHGIIQTAPQYNHPARTAERVATLDLVSNGRVDFGSGESSSEAELGGFGINYMEKRAAWQEGLEVALRCLTESPFTGHDGTYCSIPPRNVVPKPAQKPHPPLWVACSRRDTILLAAQHGMGALSFAFIDPEEAAQWVQDYERTLADECVPIGEAVNPAIACVTPMMCDRDEDRAMAMGLEGGNFFGYSLAHFYVFGDHVPGETNVWKEFVEKREEHGYSPEVALAERRETLGAKVAAGDTEGLRGAVGTPEQLRQYIRRYEDAGIDQLIFVMQAGNNRHDDICASLKLFGDEVLPEFKERQPAIEEANKRRWAPHIDAAMERRSAKPAPPPMPEGYSMTAIPKQMVDLGAGPTIGIEQDDLENLARRQALGEHDPDGGIVG